VEIGPVRLRFEYEVLRDRDLLATGHTVLAACDRDGRLVRMPDFFRTTIEPATRQEPEGRGKRAASAEVQGG
jgi:acyl-CoA thioesterase FadM